METVCEVEDDIFKPDDDTETKTSPEDERSRELFRGLLEAYSLPRLVGIGIRS